MASSPNSAGVPKSPRGRRGRAWPYVLAAVLILPAIAWLGAYFAVNSSAGQGALRDVVLKHVIPGSLEFHRAHWGPGPGQVRLYSVVIRDPSGAEAANLGFAEAKVDLAALLFDDKTIVEHAFAADFTLDLAWGSDGELNLAGLLRKKPKDVPKPPGPDEPKLPKKRRHLEIRNVSLTRGKVTVRWPERAIAVEALEASGMARLTPEDGLQIRAAASTGPAKIRLPGGKSVEVSDLVLEDVRWGEHEPASLTLTLTSATGDRIALTASGPVGGDTDLTVRGDIAVGADLARALLGGVAPGGIRLEGLSASVRTEHITATVDRARAPALALGPLTIQGLDAPLTAEVRPGVLAPTGKLVLSGAKLETLAIPEALETEDVTVDALIVGFDGRLTALAKGLRAGSATMGGGPLGAATGSLELDLDLGLEATGSASATLVTERAGKIKATALLTYRLLPQRRASAELTLRFDAASGPFAAELIARLPEALRSDLVEPLGGELKLKAKLAPRSGAPWAFAITPTAGRLNGSIGEVRHDGTRWTTAAPAMPPSAPSPPKR